MGWPDTRGTQKRIWEHQANMERRWNSHSTKDFLPKIGWHNTPARIRRCIDTSYRLRNLCPRSRNEQEWSHIRTCSSRSHIFSSKAQKRRQRTNDLNSQTWTTSALLGESSNAAIIHVYPECVRANIMDWLNHINTLVGEFKGKIEPWSIRAKQNQQDPSP